MSQKKSILDALPKNQLFILGALVSFFAITSIGFFILLGRQVSSETVSTGTALVQNPPGQQPIAPTAPTPSGPIVLPALTGDEWYKGGKDATITVVEFSDTECPFCKQFHDTMNQVIAEYGNDVKWIYKHAPLASLHSKAQKEAEATECAGEQGGNNGFWAYTDRLFEITPSNNGLAESQLPQIAEDVGLDRSKFETCLASGKFAAKVLGELQEAETAGLQGTPYSVIVVGDQNIPINGAQPFVQVKAIIDSLL